MFACMFAVPITGINEDSGSGLLEWLAGLITIVLVLTVVGVQSVLGFLVLRMSESISRCMSDVLL